MNDRDPEFATKAVAVIELLLSLPTDGPLFCVDEKPGIGVRQPTAPDQMPVPRRPPARARPARREFEYKRNGTVDLLAGFRVNDGQVCGMVRLQHRSREFCELLAYSSMAISLFSGLFLVAIHTYRGLDVFREEDAPFFAGREALLDELQRLVERRSLVALVGASAAASRRLCRPGWFPGCGSAGRRARPGTPSPSPRGDDPFFALASELIPLLTPDLGPTDLMTERRRLAGSLADGTLPLQDPLDEVRNRRRARKAATGRGPVRGTVHVDPRQRPTSVYRGVAAAD